MAEKLTFDIQVGGNQDQALGSLKAQLKQATQEVQALSDKFGATSEQAIEAAKRAAELKDQIGDAATLVDAFNPDTKFKAFSQTLGTVAGGFSAVQGALGLLGSKGEDVEKTLAKVQSALALSQGLEQLGDLGAAFTNLKGVAVDTFKGIKAAIGSTGIGVLVVALGAIVAYWDDIKEAVSGVSEEQKKLLTDTEADVKAQQEKLSAIDSQDNVLKLQGKSERDILGLKIKQTEQVIVATEKQVAQQKIVLQAQLAAEKRNKEILKGILTFVTAPLQLVIDGVNQVAKVFGKGFEFNVAEKLSGLVFDPKATEANGLKEIAALDKTLGDLKNKKAGYQLAVQNIDKQGASKSASDAERLRKEREAKEKEAQAILAEANKKLKTQQEQDLLNITEAYAEKQKKLALAGIKDNGDLAAAEQKERQAVLDKYAKEAKDLKDKNDKEAKDKEIAFQTELNKITLETKLAGIKDEGEKARVELEANFKKQREDIDANEKFTAEQKTALKIELAKKEALALEALKLAEDKKISDSELAALDKKLADNEADLQIERSLLGQKDTLLKEAFAKKLITEEQYNAGVAANAKARTEIDKQETEAKVRNAEIASQLLNTIADVLGKNTAAGKAAAIASTTIDTYLSAQKAYASQLIPGDPSSPIRAAIAAGIAIVGGIKNVKSILAVQTPSGGGGGSANISAPNLSGAPIAPPPPQAATTNLSTQSINALGNQATRAYVIESDVTSSQQRMAAIQQRARFG
jgi:hypothetical protein